MLHTDRLLLRALRVGDAPWIAREICQPDVQRWLTSPPHPYTRTDAEAFIDMAADAPWYFAIEAAAQPIGVISIVDEATRGQDHPELGYWLSLSAHGQGYMTEAAAAVVDAYFASGADALESGWVQGNTASKNVLRKLGFVRTGEVKQRRVNFLETDRPIVRVQLTATERAAALSLEPARAGG